MFALLLAAAVAVVPSRAEQVAQVELAYIMGACWYTDPMPNTDARVKAELSPALYAVYEDGKTSAKDTTPAACRVLIPEAVDRLQQITADGEVNRATDARGGR